MNLESITESLRHCPCGREHTCDIRGIWIESGLVTTVGERLMAQNFPKRLLVVADENTFAASEGILPSLENAGFITELVLYKNLKEANMKDVEHLCSLAKQVEVEAVLSIGTGSLNDICRLAAYRVDLPLAIFATAPSMDGFASGTTPIVTNGFKETHQARQPQFILADTKILAASPAELKSAGFGDMVAKYTALCDWRISHLLTGEYYCENIANLTRRAVLNVTKMADRITENDENAAKAVMEALVLTGIAMNYAKSVRPASGAEHIVAHFWEIKKLEMGQFSDFHGKKVGVATLFLSELYHSLAENETIAAQPDKTDWERVFAVYGKNFEADIRRLNTPTVTDEVNTDDLQKHWQAIRTIIKEELPTPEALFNLMQQAGAVTSLEEIAVSDELGTLGMQFHAYMRYRLTLCRLIPMLGIPAVWRGISLV